MQPSSPAQLHLAAGDTQGRSLVVGAPTKVTVTNHQQPQTVLGMPPMHVDFVPPVRSSTPTVLNLSALPNGFQATYQTQVTDTNQSSFSNTTSYSVSTTTSVGESISFVLPSIATFSESFLDTWADAYSSFVSKSYNTYSGVSFDASTQTGFSNHLWFTAVSFNVYVYPVIGFAACPVAQPDCDTGEMLPLNVMFSGPDMVRNYNVDAAKIEWYQPAHEPGNVLSYPWDEPHLVALFDGFSPLTEDPPPLWFTDTSTQSQFATWSQSGGSNKTGGSTQTHSFSNAFSVSSGTSFSFDYNSSNSFSTLYTATQTVGESTGVGVSKPGTFLDPGNYQYAVQTFVFGQNNPFAMDNQPIMQIPLTTDIKSSGTLWTAFVANPTDSLAGDWWKQTYTLPDVALNHPLRWSVTSGTVSTPPDNCLRFNPASTTVDCVAFNAPDLTDLPTSEFHQMRGLFITPASTNGQGPQTTVVTAGDALRLEARVYNYSLVDMNDSTILSTPAASVHVRFYGQTWDTTTGTFSGEAFLIGEQVVSPSPGFNTMAAGSGYNWRVVQTTFDTTGYDNTNLVFWVVVWMEDGNGNLVPEMVEHGLMNIPGTLTSLADVPIQQYSNNVGFYHQAITILPASSAEASLATARSVVEPGPGAGHKSVQIKHVDTSRRRVAPGEKMVVAATLESGRVAVPGLQVVFYDGDPRQGGKAFDVEHVPYIRAKDTYVVRVPFRSGVCGKHDLFVVADVGGPDPATRKTHVRVDCR